MRIALLLATLLLTACAGGPKGPVAPLAPVDFTLTGETGPGALIRWTAPEIEPRAVILAAHGYGDHARSTWAAPAAFWAGNGVITYGYDHRGFGRNQRGEWPGAETIIADVAAAAAAVRARHPDLPLIVLGHSMGGGAVAAAAGEGRLAGVDGIILAGPAVQSSDIGPILRAATWTTALAAPDKRWSGDGIVEFQASDNIDALRALAADPLYLGEPSAREFLGLVRIMDRAADAAGEIAAPMLLLYGAKDELVPETPVREVFDRVPTEKDFIYYPDGWHLLFRDIQREAVWRDVLDWTLARDARPGS